MRDHKGLNEIASIIRKEIVTMIHGAKSGHPGGSLSAVEILTALYFDEMNIDPTNPKMEDRDRFILSKGHAAPVLYATLAERGFFDKNELLSFRKFGAMLQGGMTGSIVKKLAYGAAVTVVSETTGSDGKIWYKIQFSSGSGTQGGYVRSDYIKFPVSYSYDSNFESYLNSQGFPESYSPIQFQFFSNLTSILIGIELKIYWKFKLFLSYY